MIKLVPSQPLASARRGIRIPAVEQTRAPMAKRAVMIDLGEAEPKAMFVVRRVLRAAVVMGMVTAAWQAGAVIGRF